jgi:hypothetical protein
MSFPRSVFPLRFALGTPIKTRQIALKPECRPAFAGWYVWGNPYTSSQKSVLFAVWATVLFAKLGIGNAITIVTRPGKGLKTKKVEISGKTYSDDDPHLFSPYVILVILYQDKSIL